ncbi:amino acid adenylation domain-containing protein [Methylocystis sp.]|uniref:amino acid adenylation domain-containing protein n=1 Tax=Methylocystis sp. TaxID=1911079 RepID=UPI003DA2E83C
MNEDFKRRIVTQTVLPRAETATPLFWPLLASGQIVMRKVDSWETFADKPFEQVSSRSLTSPLDRITSCRPKTTLAISNTSRDRTYLMSDSEERIELLSPKQRTLFYSRSGTTKPQVQLPKPILRRDPGIEPPLSFAQRRLWFLQQLEPQNPFYNEPLLAIRLTGSIVMAQIQRVFDSILARHDSLRSSFPSVAGVPRVVISPSVHLPITMVDLSSFEANERERDFTRITRSEARHIFDLSQGPLIRVTLVRMSSDCHVLLVAMHHIISDGWSLRILIRELASPDVGALPGLPVQYCDYARWERELLDGPHLTQLLSYWKRQLHDAPFELTLKTDKPRPRVPSYRGGQVEFMADPELLEALRAIAHRGNYTLYMVLLSAFLVLLHHYTRHTDIVLGTPVAGRNHSHLENLIGFFVNTLVLRVDLSGNPRFHEIMNRVRENVLDAFAHNELPFDRLVEELNPRRDPSRHPLFQVMFVHHNFRPDRYEVDGLLLERIDIFSEVTKFDLVLITDETVPGKLQIQLDYAFDLFEPATAQAMLDDFQALLKNIAREPAARLNTIHVKVPLRPQQEDAGGAEGCGSPTPDEPRTFAAALHNVCRDHRISTIAFITTALQIALMRLGIEDKFELHAAKDGQSSYKGRRIAIEDRLDTHETFVDAAIRNERLLVEGSDASAPLGEGTCERPPLGFLVDEIDADFVNRLELPDASEMSFRSVLVCTLGRDDFRVQLNERQGDPNAAGMLIRRTFVALIQAAVREPQTRLSYLPLVDEATRKHLVSDINRISRAPNPLRIDEQFEQRVTSRPDATAIECGWDRWTYAELSIRSNKLAHRLQQHRVGEDSIVACHLESSGEAVMAVLAVLKAGGAFFLVSPNQPSERIRILFEQIRPQLVLTTSSLRSKLPETAIEIMCLDTESPSVEPEPATKLGNADSLAFLAVTSGTTGEPKVAMICHAGVVNITAAHGISQTARVAHVNSFGFDGAISEIFIALLSGATLVIIDPARRYADELVEELERNRIDTLIAVPSLLVTLAPRWLNRPGITVFSVGEPCPPNLARSWSTLCKFYNAYGPAEACICSHMWHVPADWTPADGPVPVGRVVPHVSSYILDERLEPVPAGMIGELFIGGIGVGRGYLFQAAATAERFLPDPFANLPGQRMYRSGDLASYTSDGTIELHGRRDEQIKIRGMRIHPAEIERTVSLHPSVAEFVVVPSRDAAGAASLTAYATVTPYFTVSELDAELLDGWKMLADEAPYEQCADEEFNTTGWRSSYDGTNVPAEEMQDLVEQATERILLHHPRRVLEVGCGTGLLLFRIAPLCESYCGVDFSGPAIDNICSRLSRPPWLPNVKIVHKRADDLNDLADATFDTAILNSVIQYFPSPAYLRCVIERALDRVEDGGIIFVGDVRHLGLLNAFHSSVAIHRSRPGDTIQHLKEAVERRVRGEGELVVSPEFFLDLQAQLKRIRYVIVQPKRGRYWNEFNRFRYDVVLHVGGDVVELDDLPWVDWDASDFDAVKLRRHLAEVQPDCLAFRNVPNARLELDFCGLAALQNNEAATVAELRSLLASHRSYGLDPEWFYTLADSLPYEVELSWLSNADQGRFDVILRRRGISRKPFKMSAAPASGTVWPPAFTNRPAKEKFVARAAVALRRFASEKLPTHMVPTEIHVVDKLPRMPSGKLDRSGLRSWVAARDKAPRNPVGRGPIEQAVADIWGQVLNHSNFSVSSDFFAVGGHSLLAAQVIARINSLCQCDLPVRAIFDAPTIEMLAQVVVAQRSDTRPPQFMIEQRDNSDEEVLSYDQRRLWFLEQLAPGTSRYHIPMSLELTGRLDRAALDDALNLICQRHEQLHSRVIETNGIPAQLIEPNLRVPLQTIDLSDLPNQERARAAERLQIESFTKVFDFGKGPLIRGLLLRLSETVHVLHLTVHHIVADGWSVLLMIRELGELYEARILGRPPSLKELPLRYADYISWQKEWLKSERFHASAEYWMKHLAGLSPLELPTDRLRGPVQTYRGKRLCSVVPRTLLRQLDALIASEGVTRFMLLVSAFQVLLSRFTGQVDIAIGSPIANRENSLLEHLVGFFANTLVLRCDLSSCRTFRDVLRHGREVALAAYDHQSVPFAKLVELLRPARLLNREPVIQIWFSYFSLDLEDMQLPELRVTFPEVPCVAAEFELSLSVRETKEGLSCAWIYNTDLFDSETIRQIAECFTALLSGVAWDLDVPISALPLLTAEQEHTILRSGQGCEAPIPALPIHELIEAKAAALPHVCAVSADGVNLTYGEFNGLANRLARYLQHLGVTPGAPIGVLMEPGVEAVLTILAALKSGGLYVALDPALPDERLQRMLTSASLFAVVTTPAAVRPDLNVPQYIVLSQQLFSQLDRHDAGNLNTPVGPRDLAYFAFTSGSTGVPKGVPVQHQALVNVLLSLANDLALNETTVMCAGTSMSFDVSALEWFSPLLQGGAVVVASRSTMLDAELLSAFLQTHKVTLLQGTPTLFRSLIAADWLGGGALTILCGGETLQRDLADELLRRCARLVNLYGPTETTIWSTWEDIRLDGKPISIGRPVNNTRCYVLDAELNIVPPQMIGELYIGGCGVALGYLCRPSETAERFLPDPFSASSGARMYRTGDYVRRHRDGTLIHVGRADRQVKIRGCRVEMGEIEAVLREHPDVRQAAVVSAPHESEGSSLTAYWISGPGAGPSAAELRQFLRSRLPSYMIPASLTKVRSLPTTQTGKADNKMLISVAATAEQRPVRTGPRSLVEKAVARIWALVLEKDSSTLGSTDDFFNDLGGHSLLALQVVSLVRRLFRIRLPVRSLFEAPMLSDFVQYIEAARVSAAVQISAHERSETRPFSPSQRRNYALASKGYCFTHIVAIALRFVNKIDKKALGLGLEALVAQHEALRMAIRLTDGVAYQTVVAPGPSEIIELHISDLPTGNSDLLWPAIADEVLKLIDLQRRPSLRAVRVRTQLPGECLVLVAPRMFVDEQSMWILSEDLAAILRGASMGHLEPLSIQYLDYLAWTADWRNTSGYVAQLASFVRGVIGDIGSRSSSRADYPLAKISGQCAREWSPSPTLLIVARKLAEQVGVNLTELLLAAFLAAFHQIDGRDAILVGLRASNRDWPGCDRIVGSIADDRILCIRFAQELSLSELSRQVSEATLDAFLRRDLASADVLDQLAQANAGRRINVTVLFQVSENVCPYVAPGVEAKALFIRPPDVELSFVLDLSEEKLRATIYCDKATLGDGQVDLLVRGLDRIFAQTVDTALSEGH